MTEKEREILYKLLIDLFLEKPKRKQPQAKEGREKHESISTRESGSGTEPRPDKTTPHK